MPLTNGVRDLPLRHVDRLAIYKATQVARPTGEAELTALATALLAMQGLENLLHSMFVMFDSFLFGDNDASIAMAHGQHSWRSRALCNRSAGIKSRIDEGTLNLGYVKTSEQKADGLTNFLSVPLVSRSRMELRIVLSK